MKKIAITGIIAAVSLVSMSIGAVAASNLEEIQAYLNKGVSITLHGEKWTPKDSDGSTLYPITYNGSTYLPVRAVAEAAGLPVEWKGDIQTVALGESKEAPSSGTTSRTSPAAIGKIAQFAVADYFDNYSGDVSVGEILRGEAAWKKLQADNKFNQPAEDGYEYILAKITIKMNTIKKENTKVDISPVNFTLVSSDGRDYETLIGTSVEPNIRTSLYAGASHTGWVPFQVKKDDTNPVITYARSYDGSGGAWLATK